MNQSHNATLGNLLAGRVIRSHRTAPLTWRIDGFRDQNGRTVATLHCLTDVERKTTLPLNSSVWAVQRACPGCGDVLGTYDEYCSYCPTCADCGTTENVTVNTGDDLCADCSTTRAEEANDGC